MKHFIVYDLSTGAVLRSGICQDQDFDKQPMAGEGVMEATSDAIVVAEVNLEPVRQSLYAAIDASADEFCLQFVTPGVTQSMRYQQKLAEAKAWTSGANPADFVFLALEAQATGVTIDALAASVLAKAAEWLGIGAKVEAARMKAKKDIADATNVAEMHTAAQIDWAAVVAAN